MTYKLVSALAKGCFAISEEGVHGYFPLAQNILNGTHHVTAEDLPGDDFEPAYDEPMAEQQGDEFTGRIAVMRVTGVLMHYGGMCSYGTEDYAARLDDYAADESIAGGIIMVDTPGGQVDGIESLRESVINFKAKKPLIVLVNDGRMASGGVWGFGGATEVYAANTLCMIGSVGVMATLLDIRKALEKNGITQIIIRAPQSVDKCKDYDDALDGKTAAIEAELKFICDRFINVVTLDRGEKLTSTEWNTGKMFFAGEAVRIGLIDGIKNYAEVKARMQELIVENQNNQNNQNTMFGNKLPRVAALKDAATITAADLEAANQEIEAFGISGVTMVLDSELETHASNTATIGNLRTEATTKDARITELEGQVKTLQTKLDGKPAAEVTAPAAEQDTITDTGGEPDYVPTSVDREKQNMAANWK
ncbi:hypothetical protein GCM10023149_30920 [Mucilaginibacter gynuensis]|uniref:Peptidase S49 domain-containing protein n=1 Tax=Mucilaginibacter gynuensis TaxID=1302236 RepID=A0ABP8GNV2_9SPHI